jgi:hypothetical protein
MAATHFSDLTSDWQASKRYTASGATDINLSCTSGYLCWTITSSDTAPTIAASQANPIRRGRDKAMQLADGDRLWMATLGPSGAATVEV